MTLLVPFDDSELSRTALRKAANLGDVRDEEVLVLSVIPDDPDFARERGWIAPDEPLRIEAVESALQSRAKVAAPESTFRIEFVDSEEPTATAAATVTKAIRRVASEVDASIVFVGSENAGSVIRPDSSVGGPVVGDGAYDVYVVRTSS